MKKKNNVNYSSAQEFLLECVRLNAFPLIHWRNDEIGFGGFIYFEYGDEVHVFCSFDKKLLDSIWNSVGLVRHVLKKMEEKNNEA